MTIILFHGLGCSKKSINYIYNGKIYNKNNFIKLLEKIDTVYNYFLLNDSLVIHSIT